MFTLFPLVITLPTSGAFALVRTVGTPPDGVTSTSVIPIFMLPVNAEP
jgi:hypothetical protein